MIEIIATIVFLASSLAHASSNTTTLPVDVSSFVENRDLCDHFRGEDPYNEERRAFLEKNMLDLCTGTDTALENLKEKYINKSQVMLILNKYESKIEASSNK